MTVPTDDAAEERFQQRLAEATASVDCPFCGRDMVNNVCPGCDHDPSTRTP